MEIIFKFPFVLTFDIRGFLTNVTYMVKAYCVYKGEG